MGICSRFFFLLLVSQVVVVAQGIEEAWMDSVQTAQRAAEKRNCPLLIAFLGPNWCSFSDKLEEEVLFQDEFISQLKDQVVFVKVDIPKDFEQRSFYGKALKQKYCIDECPCVVLADSDGGAIAKLEYLPIGCAQFATYVKQVLDDYNRVSHLVGRELKQLKVDEVKHLYARSGRFVDTRFRIALLEQGLKIDRGPYFLAEQYARLLAEGTGSRRKLKRIRNKVLARDPKNEEGCLRKLALSEFASMGDSANPEQAIAPLLQYLKRFGSEDAENAWRLEMKISQYLFGKHCIEGALEHAKRSYDLAPDTAQKEIAQSIQYLQTFLQ